MKYIIREMDPSEADLIIEYFLTSSQSFLQGIGVDPGKLPSYEEWREILKRDSMQPIKWRRFYYLLWTTDDVPFGHCNINKIVYGQHAYMHLHIWECANRLSGNAVDLVRHSLKRFFSSFDLQTIFCEPYAFNAAPNRVLTKVGFTFLESSITTPGWINFRQKVNRWRISRETLLRDSGPDKTVE